MAYAGGLGPYHRFAVNAPVYLYTPLWETVLSADRLSKRTGPIEELGLYRALSWRVKSPVVGWLILCVGSASPSRCPLQATVVQSTLSGEAKQ